MSESNTHAKSDATERELIRAVMHSTQEADDALASGIQESDFRIDLHQRIWKSVVSCRSCGVNPTLTGVAEIGGREGWLTRADYPALAEVYDGYAPKGQTEWLCGLVRDASVLRQLEQAGQGIARRGREPHGSAAEMLAASEADLRQLAENRMGQTCATLGEAMGEALAKLDSRIILAQQGLLMSGIPTGSRGLENIVPGWQDSELIVIAARPGVGKTSFAMTTTLAAGRANRPVFFASLEMARDELAARMLGAETGIDGADFRVGNLPPEEQTEVISQAAKLGQLPVRIDDASCQSVVRIHSVARRLARLGQCDMVIVDYLQLLEPEDKGVPRVEQVGQISRGLKRMARDLKVPVIALAQLNREVEGRGSKPRLSDLRESGSIEADADTVILLHVEKQFPGELLFIVAKQRNGATGEHTVRFDRARMRFTELNEEAGDFGDDREAIPA